MLNRLLCGLFVFSVMAVSVAQAEVSLKNGNFFTGARDLVYPGGFEPKIERVYNSKTSFKGIFGFGWGNEYEAYLSVEADGSVVVHEYGGGAENRFSPQAFNFNELNQAVQTIATAAKKAGMLGSSEQMASYQNRLKGDASFRNREWEKFRAQGKVPARTLAENTQLHSNHFSYEYITKVKGGYIRSFDSGRVERFNEAGKLARVSDAKKNFIDLTYGPDGHLVKIVDNFNRKMFFAFNLQGMVSRIQGENDKEATYRYNDRGELVWTKDSGGNVYSYKYDAEGQHNMVEIGYPDRTTMQIAYYPRAQYESVKSVKDRDNTLIQYAYKVDGADKGHYTITVRVSSAPDKDNPRGKLITSSTYEYQNKHKADGESWTYKMITTIDGNRTETTYNECCGLPLIIKRAGEETDFEYDAKGHVTRKISPTEVTELSYDPRVSKVSRVIRYSKTDKKDKRWSTFEYDDKGNLKLAKNSDKKVVALFYDGNGLIHSMVDQDRRRIDFKYNENSKPIEISDPALGSITVTYNNSGEVKKIDSSAGRSIALQVTSAFQNLLDIIRPAGVTLSF